MNVRDEFQPLVRALLSEFGAPATITRAATNQPAAANAKFNAALRGAADTPTVTQTLAVLEDLETTNDAGRVIMTTRATVLAEPREGDTLTLAGKSWRVGSVTTIQPQGQAIAYQAVVS